MCDNRHNREYLEDVLKVGKEKEEEYLDAMKKYSFDWWNSSNPEDVVRYQLKEQLLLVLFSKLQNALETVLQRPVNPKEISFINLSLKLEAYEALGLN